MIQIVKGSNEDFPTIQKIAHLTWPGTFKNILSEDQISYMLEMMYSLSSLTEQIEKKKHKFFLAKENGKYLGFASCEINYSNSPKTKIHKIYILPEAQGMGVGKALIAKITETAINYHNQLLILNVNRYNPSIKVYEKWGFAIVKEENIPIGNGYLMEDFVMEKEIKK